MQLVPLQQVVADAFGRNYPTEVGNGWLKLPCPISPWTHERGQDRNPSSGISVHDNGTSIFNCFTCHAKMPLAGLLTRYQGYSGEDLGTLIEEVEEGEYLGPTTAPEWDEGDVEEVDEPLDETLYLDLYDPAAGHPYLEERGVADLTAESLQLMVDPEDPLDGEERILFPVFGLDRKLYGFSGRATNKGATLKVRDYAGLRKAHHLLGAHMFADGDMPYVIVVEGLVDYARMWNAGYPAVASMHSQLTDRQIALLKEIGLPVYLMFDDDQAGRDGVAKAIPKLRDSVPTHSVTYPDVWIPDDSPEGGHWAKDPGEMPPEFFAEMIREARLH